MLISVGLDFRSTTVAERERWVIRDEDLPRLYRGLQGAGVSELVAVRTCNRTEIYAWETTREPDAGALLALWARVVSAGELPRRQVVVRREDAAGEHLCRVSSGLESQVLGDIHILGQIRNAYREAIEHDGVGTHLRRLFDSALRAGKRVRTETELMAGRSSVGSEAARDLLGRVPRGSTVLVLGCGKVGSHAARTLSQSKHHRVVLVNRTFSRAQALARDCQVDSAPYEELGQLLQQVSGVVVATGASSPILHASDLTGPSDRGKDLVILDVALPRNVAPDVGELPWVTLRDLDDVHPEASQVEEARREAIPAAEAVIRQELDGFREWRAGMGASEALRPLRELLLEVTRREVGYTAREEDEVDRVARRVAAKVMARPMIAMRESGLDDEEVRAVTHTLHRLFGEGPSNGNGTTPTYSSNGLSQR